MPAPTPTVDAQSSSDVFKPVTSQLQEPVTNNKYTGKYYASNSPGSQAKQTKGESINDKLRNGISDLFGMSRPSYTGLSSMANVKKSRDKDWYAEMFQNLVNRIYGKGIKYDLKSIGKSYDHDYTSAALEGSINGMLPVDKVRKLINTPKTNRFIAGVAKESPDIAKQWNSIQDVILRTLKRCIVLWAKSRVFFI
jgi:hypothetical protein